MDEKKTDLLLAEYMQLQKTVEDFDAKAITIKAWSVTVSAAGIVGAYMEGVPFVLIIAAVSALIFWFVEAQWKANQQAYYPRIREIEKALATGGDIAPLQIASSWSKAWYADRERHLILSILTWTHVWLPYLPVAAAAFLLFFLHTPEKKPEGGSNIAIESASPTSPDAAVPE